MSQNNSINCPIPVVVADGGTGNTTFTAYSVICAGTTATGAFQNVSGVGSSGNVLTSNGASALPTWQAAAAAGALTKIATATASSSASITFPNDLSATYDNYMITMENVLASAGGSGPEFQLIIGFGATPTYDTTSGHYSWMSYGQIASNTGAAVNTNSTPTDTHISLSGGAAGVTSSWTNSAGKTGGGVLYIFNANSTNYVNIAGQLSYVDVNLNYDGLSAHGIYLGGNVVTSLKFQFNTGNITSGVFKLYGISN